MENYMTDDQIIDFIKKYIDKTSYNYAVLIDGSWGAGKTYFIENKLIPSLKEAEKSKANVEHEYKEKKILYISLYGITSKDELAKQMFIETLPFSKLFKSKKFSVISGLGKSVLVGGLSYAGITIPDKIVDNIDFDIAALRNCILIFDDLERCNMNINEILGYINNFVEHDNTKVIIAANEKEINTSRNTLNKELKYLIASKENITFPKESEKKEEILNYSNGSKLNDGHINIDELDKRMNLLFREDEIYKLIKEKLIGVTIYYKSEVISIIEELVNKNEINEKIKEIILKNRQFIKGRFDFYEHQNIRTLLFALDKFESLMENLKDDIDFKKFLKVLDEIFKYIIVCSIIYKSGKQLYTWKNDNEIDDIPMTDISNPCDYVKGFKFIDDFISMNIFNKKKAIDIIKRENEILRAKVLDYSDPLYRLNIGWWYMEDEEALKTINEVIWRLDEDPKNYNPVNYSSILHHNIVLNRIGVSNINTQDILKIMKNNLKLLRIEINFNTFGYAPIFDEEQDKLKYSEAMEELNEELKQVHEETKEMKLKDILKNADEWSNKLSQYAFENSNEILSQKAFLSKLKEDELISALKSSTNEQITGFRSTIKHTIYSFSNINEYYKEDKITIEKIINELEIYLNEIKDKHKIRTVNFQYLINDLKDIYQRLS